MHHHGHDHDGHDHHHHHVADPAASGRIFIIGMILNGAFVVAELVVGFIAHSLSLIADAWHNLGDVAGLGISLLAFGLSKIKPNAQFTYGYRKSTILASLTNAVLLLIAVGVIGFEAVQRLITPVPAEGWKMAIVAGAGILVNGFTAYLFIGGKDKEMNMRGAYLHMASDAVVSLGVVIAGVLIALTGWNWLDPAISLGIILIIVWGTWSLLRDSLRLSLDGVPAGIDLEKIRDAALKIPGIQDIHHIHVWAMSTTRNALTAHILTDSGLSDGDLTALKGKLKHSLEHLNIQHATLETESTDCKKPDC